MPLGTPYTTEILPFSIRAKGIAISTISTYASLCINTWVNPIAMAAISWKYYFVYIAILIYLLCVAYFTFPETKGRTLEEVAYVFGDIPEESLTRGAPHDAEKLAGDSDSIKQVNTLPASRV